MKTKESLPTDVGIIIGRFQVHELHEAHTDLIDTVQSKHDKVIIFVGLSPLRNTPDSPLDFNARKRMIQESYPDIDVYYVRDNRSDTTWSKNLDKEIYQFLKPFQTATLYGSRDSFIPHYNGAFPVEELESTKFISGTEIRRRIANHFPASKEFRAGVIAASLDRYPSCYATVDVAIFDGYKRNRVLLGKKPGEGRFRFIGGFSSPSSVSYEADARREVTEEAGIEIDGVSYIGSCLVDDWRYRKSPDKIKTLFFVAQHTFGRPIAADDIESVEWVDTAELISGNVFVMEEHEPLVKMLGEFLTKEKLRKEQEMINALHGAN